jgi:uncharacterized protein (TIGR02452 family)
MKEKGFYPIGEYGAIYSPHVQVFRKSEKDGLAFQKPLEIDCIASAAYCLIRGRMTDKYEKGMLEKIRSIFRMGIEKGHDSLVLGAFGCGAFRNDPRIISKFFKQVIEEIEFKNKFRLISFAIIDDHNATKGSNFNIFKETFTNPSPELSLLERIFG